MTPTISGLAVRAHAATEELLQALGEKDYIDNPPHDLNVDRVIAAEAHLFEFERQALGVAR